MTTVEKAAYLKGLADGMGMSDSKEGKLWEALCDLVSDMAHEIEDLQINGIDMAEAINDLTDSVNELEELTADLDLDEELLDDDDNESCCGCCGSDDDMDDYLNIAPDDEDEEDSEYDGLVYECTCPACGEEVVFGEEELEKGSIPCPGCGEILEFDPDAE